MILASVAMQSPYALRTELMDPRTHHALFVQNMLSAYAHYHNLPMHGQDREVLYAINHVIAKLMSIATDHPPPYHPSVLLPIAIELQAELQTPPAQESRAQEETLLRLYARFRNIPVLEYFDPNVILAAKQINQRLQVLRNKKRLDTDQAATLYGLIIDLMIVFNRVKNVSSPYYKQKT
jgi:hypothetical protein